MSANPTITRRRLARIAAGVVLSLSLAACSGDDTNADGPSTDEKSFGQVTVTGTKLPELKDGEPDTSVGMAAPTITMDRPSAEQGVIGGVGRATLVVFLAHWCPHCQAEVPVIVKAAAERILPDVRLIAVATGTNPQAPNFPPGAWLTRESWPGEILLDDEDFTAAIAYGLANYPYIVAIDAAGNVTARASGELTAAQLAVIAQSAL